MKTVLSIVAMLAIAGSVSACPPLGVCSQAVAVQSVQVQSFAPVAAYAVPQVALQSFAVIPQAQVQTFSVHAFVGQPIVVQNVHVRQVRQPRQVVRTRTVVRSR